MQNCFYVLCDCWSKPWHWVQGQAPGSTVRHCNHPLSSKGLLLFLLYCNRLDVSLSLWFKLWILTNKIFKNPIRMYMNLLQSLSLATGIHVISVKGCIFPPLSYKVKWCLWKLIIGKFELRYHTLTSASGVKIWIVMVLPREKVVPGVGCNLYFCGDYGVRPS